MSQKDIGRPVRKMRAKREPRPRKGKSIIFRVTDDVQEIVSHLKAAA